VRTGPGTLRGAENASAPTTPPAGAYEQFRERELLRREVDRLAGECRHAIKARQEAEERLQLALKVNEDLRARLRDLQQPVDVKPEFTGRDLTPVVNQIPSDSAIMRVLEEVIDPERIVPMPEVSPRREVATRGVGLPMEANETNLQNVLSGLGPPTQWGGVLPNGQRVQKGLLYVDEASGITYGHNGSVWVAVQTDYMAFEGKQNVTPCEREPSDRLEVDIRPSTRYLRDKRE
jgi:hypothetical protein